MSEIDAAHILFPNDTPKPGTAPEWFVAERTAAEQRLSGQHAPKSAVEAQARPAPPAGNDADAAAVLFGNDVPAPDKAISEALASRMDAYELDARLSGEVERGDELASAMSSLTADFSKNGTSVSDVREMVDLLHDGKARPTPITSEEAATGYANGMERLAEDYGDHAAMSADLSRARRFVADLATVTPGVIETLEASGMGNDVRMIRLAIREARRRGY